jgi:branched-chain amino acid transport system ATP-binding protein
MLEARGLTAFYGDFQALFGIDFRLEEGETVAIIGANGAGKSTFLRAITGQLPARIDQIWFDGRPIAGLSADAVVKLGISMAPEGRLLFPSLTVEENLLIGAYAGRKGPWSLERVYTMFPRVRERRHLPGPALSGGEQQMVAIGRALMANPRLLLCDEISLGLAPIVIRDIYRTLPTIKAEGTTVLLVEQDINQALSVASRVYCFQEGRVTLKAIRASSRASASPTPISAPEAYARHIRAIRPGVLLFTTNAARAEWCLVRENARTQRSASRRSLRACGHQLLRAVHRRRRAAFGRGPRLSGGRDCGALPCRCAHDR